MPNTNLSPPYVKKLGEDVYVVMQKRTDNGKEFEVSPRFKTMLQANTHLDGLLNASASSKAMANTGSAA